MRIQVTQEDIDLGEWANAYKCALARACSRAFGDAHCCVVPDGKKNAQGVYDATVVLVGGPNTARRLPLPQIAHEFRHRTDSGAAVAPLEFDLELL